MAFCISSILQLGELRADNRAGYGTEESLVQGSRTAPTHFSKTTLARSIDLAEKGSKDQGLLAAIRVSLAS